MFVKRCRFVVVVVGLFVCSIFLSDGCVLLVPNRLGCTDADALNYDSSADVDDGSCRYSRVVFYASANQYEYVPDVNVNQLFNIPIESIVVHVDGSTRGKLRVYFPSGPLSCSAPGTLSYEFRSGDAVEWRALVVLENGKELVTAGKVRPRRESKCIPIDVTTDGRRSL